MTNRNDLINTVRSFNRSYTRQIGLLEEGLLKSEFSLTEVRVLHELAHAGGLFATDLARDLSLDRGYLSRLLKKLEHRGLVTREPSKQDGRQAVLALSAEGRRAFDRLDQAAHDEVNLLLDRLTDVQQVQLVKAMSTIQRLLGDLPEDKVPYILRTPQSGDYGWIIHRQAVLYQNEYRFDETYEALIAEILSGFIRNFDPRYERGWIAERDSEVVGSVFVVRESGSVARLRLLYVDPVARGLGIGTRLVEECIRFARAKGYKTLTLWTSDVLHSAQRIYKAAGFTLTSEEPHHSFGQDLIGQHWTLAL